MPVRKTFSSFLILVLGAIAIFLHVGTQVVAIDTIIGYANSMHINLLEAKVFPSYTLAATICGYVLGILCIPRFIRQVNALRFCTLLGTILTLLILFSKGQVSFLGHVADISIWFVVLLRLRQFVSVGRYMATGIGMAWAALQNPVHLNDNGPLW